MPIFDYQCPDCKHIQEFLDTQSNEVHLCVKCELPKTMSKLMSAGNFKFKGSGFYENDYKNKT